MNEALAGLIPAGALFALKGMFLMSVIMLQSDLHNTCVDKLRELIFYFSAQTREELLSFFPTEKEGLIDNSLKILERRGEIQQKEYMGQTYYFEKKYKSDFQRYWDFRNQYLSSLDFLRLMINSTDEKGYLVNDIRYVGVGKMPCTLFFSANKKLFEIYSIPLEDFDFYIHLIQTSDKQNEYITDPHNPRIVIVDSESYIDRLLIKNVLYFAIYNKNTRTFRILEGNQL